MHGGRKKRGRLFEIPLAHKLEKDEFNLELMRLLWNLDDEYKEWDQRVRDDDTHPQARMHEEEYMNIRRGYAIEKNAQELKLRHEAEVALELAREAKDKADLEYCHKIAEMVDDIADDLSLIPRCRHKEKCRLVADKLGICVTTVQRKYDAVTRGWKRAYA